MDAIINYLTRGLTIELSEVVNQIIYDHQGVCIHTQRHPTDPGTVHGAFWSGEQAVCALEHQFNQLN